MLHNGNKDEYKINKEDRIAQLLCIKCKFCRPVEIGWVEPTERGEGSFGSTGK